jgi:hypothetical protein
MGRFEEAKKLRAQNKAAGKTFRVLYREARDVQKETRKQKEGLRKATREKKHQAKETVKQERKTAEAAVIEARGKPLGGALLSYNGGFGSEFKKGASGFLLCYENEVRFKHRKAPITIQADQVTGFEVTGQKQTSTTSRITATRMLTLGVFSLAAPKRSTKTEKETYVCITLKDGRQVFFFTSTDTPEKVQRKLSDAISHYGRMHAAQSNQQPEHSQDAAGEIARFAELRRRGILTEAEFNAKKQQLLGL